MARRPVSIASAAPLCAGDGSCRLHRGAGGLVYHRGRPPTLYGLRAAPHRRLRVTAGGARGWFFADRLHRGLFHRVCGGHNLPFAADGNAAASGRTRAERRRANARGRHYARGCCRRTGACAMTGMIDIPVLWAFIIAFAVFVYVVMDGFDLGLGMLFPLFPKKADRDVMMNTVAPVWDGNETWLVLGGGGLMAAFPLAYAVLMPALYTPIIAMLIGLTFRGVAFEFRWRTTRERNLWDIAFFGGSLVAAMAQGIALGAVLQGVHVDARHYAGGWWDWLTPFSILTGVSVVVGYTLLGASWLVMKTERELRDEAYRLSRWLLFAMIAAIGAVSLATPFLDL